MGESSRLKYDAGRVADMMIAHGALELALHVFTVQRSRENEKLLYEAITMYETFVPEEVKREEAKKDGIDLVSKARLKIGSYRSSGKH